MIKQVSETGSRLGVFASSFNPPTLAHAELIKREAEALSLDQVIALASSANADKLDYECALEDRLAMLTLAFADQPRTSIGLSSRGFYVDMIDALDRIYPQETDLHFIVGFDTFERVLDPENRYTERYYRPFSGRTEALQHLTSRARLIVAGRAGAGWGVVEGLFQEKSADPPQA